MSETLPGRGHQQHIKDVLVGLSYNSLKTKLVVSGRLNTTNSTGVFRGKHCDWIEIKTVKMQQKMLQHLIIIFTCEN